MLGRERERERERGGGGGGGEGVILVRVCESQYFENYPIHIPKTDPFIY